MQTKRILVLLICAVISASSVFAAVPFGKPAAIVKFNGQTKPISETDLDAQVNNVVATYKSQGQTIAASAIRKQVLDSMIDNLLLESGAQRDGVVISDQQVQTLLAQQKYLVEQQAGRTLTEEEFETIINQQVGSLDDYKDYLKSQALINQYLLMKKGDILKAENAMPTEDEIQSYYRANKASLVNPECVNLAQIFVPFKDNATNDKNEKALESVAADLQANKITWNNAVAQYNKDTSNTKADGDIGWLTQDDTQNIKTLLGNEYFDTAFDLKVGGTSDVIVTSQGYHILKVKDHVDTKLLSIDDPISPADSTTVREYITQILSNQKAQNLAQQALVSLTKDLRNDATITYLTK
ncbi:MAG: peptidyl-prolyl cis-trans isomerase [Pleomorphochaeta sp.]